MERLTHKRENGIKRGYWSPKFFETEVDRNGAEIECVN